MCDVEHSSTRSPASGRVLIVDEYPEVGRLLHMAFSAAGFDVVETASLGEAQECLNQQWPQVAILDFKRSETHGLYALHWLRACPEFDALPVVFLSGAPCDGVEWRARQVGADAFSMKPFSVLDLIDRVHGLARSGRPYLRVIAGPASRRRAG